MAETIGMTAQSNDLDENARHPIAVVADRTGLSQDVLRVWERRYGAVKPGRGPGGQRRYSDADVERLRLLHAATRAGRSIGQVAQLPLAEIERLVAEDVAARSRLDEAISDMAAAPSELDLDASLDFVRSLDAAGLNAQLRRMLAQLGVAMFVDAVAVPLLRRAGDEWHAGRMTPAQEHVASSVVQDLITETMRSFGQRPGAARVLVATPARERHLIGAALTGVTAALEEWNVIYLGGDLPAAEIAGAAVAAEVRLVAVSVIYVDDRERVLAELRALRAQLPASIGLLVGGAGGAELARELSLIGVRVGTSMDELRAELRRELQAA